MKQGNMNMHGVQSFLYSFLSTATNCVPVSDPISSSAAMKGIAILTELASTFKQCCAVLVFGIGR